MTCDGIKVHLQVLHHPFRRVQLQPEEQQDDVPRRAGLPRAGGGHRLRDHAGPLASLPALLVCLTLAGRLHFLFAADMTAAGGCAAADLLCLDQLDANLARPDACHVLAERMLLRFVATVGLHVRRSRSAGFAAFRARLAVALDDWERWKEEWMEHVWGDLQGMDHAWASLEEEEERVWGNLVEDPGGFE